MNLEELKKVVEKATPGPWQVGMRNGANANMIFRPDGTDQYSDSSIAMMYDIPMNQPVERCLDAPGMPTAQFIATFNPSLVSKLLNAAECLKDMREEYVKLPHSLGYDFTHLPKIDAALRDLEQS